MAHYIALIHKDANSDYGVSFPDFPGCISAGSTLEEARRMGAEALALHIAVFHQPAPPTGDVSRRKSPCHLSWKNLGNAYFLMRSW